MIKRRVVGNFSSTAREEEMLDVLGRKLLKEMADNEPDTLREYLSGDGLSVEVHKPLRALSTCSLGQEVYVEVWFKIRKTSEEWEERYEEIFVSGGEDWDENPNQKFESGTVPAL